MGKNRALIEKLRSRLDAPLPGLKAQMRMTSRPNRDKYPIREDHRKSGVLALLYLYEQQLYTVFMQRTPDRSVHSGQVSFPGGRLEPGDPDLIFTALREAEEELGIPADGVDVLGQLSPLYIPPSNFMVYPTVGFMKHRPDFVASEREVAQIIEVKITTFFREETRQTPTINVRDQLRMKVPAFLVKGHIIWGATAMMLNELLEVVEEIDFKNFGNL